MVLPDFTLNAYKHLLRQFQLSGYTFHFFGEDIPEKQGLFLRHDVDFDCSLALDMARAEQQTGVKSTYFFLVASQAYNPMSSNVRKSIEAIKAMGHQISLHFDPEIYTNFEAGLHDELDIFERIFQVRPKVISLHRPQNYFLQHEGTIAGVGHTYQPVWFKNMSYYADSQGQWRYGHPLKSNGFKDKKNIHLLVHPLWWVLPGNSPEDKLRLLFEKQVNRVKSHDAANCKPFINILNSL